MKIPKIIHQIWIGPNEPPKFMNTWKENHPDYEYILWGNEMVKGFLPIKNQHLYDQYDNETRNIWNGRANLLRYEILYKYGGIYVDADAKSLRPLEGDFLESDFFIVRVNEKKRGNRLNNCFIGSIPQHPLMEKCIDELNKFDLIQQPSFQFSGPVFITEIVNKYGFDVTVLPSYYFSPYFFERGGVYKGDFKPFADHQWGTTRKLYGKI